MKPLFTQNFLSHYLINFKLSNVPNIRFIRNTIKNLIIELDSGRLVSLKEEEFKSRFLCEFFGDILGFNYGNSNFWTLAEEVKTKVDGTKADGALGYFYKDKNVNDVRAVIEIKDINTELDKKQNRKDAKSPISQAFEYFNKMGDKCKWVIVSNFKEIRFYSSFQGQYQVFFLKELSNENKLKELLFLFHKDKFIKNGAISKTEQLYKISRLGLTENEKPRHILDEIYSSLIRFKGLRYIDPNYLANMKPFNILNENVWHYSNRTLMTLNPKIHDFFEKLEFENGEIIISSNLKSELESLEVIEYQEKIKTIIDILNHCLVDQIECVKDYQKVIDRNSNTIGFSHKHSFHFSDHEGFSKDINILNYKSCDCISCNFKNLDFDYLLKKLKARQNDDEYETLEYAYGNYLIGTDNYKKAYYTYKRLSERVKGKEGFEIQYFLAKLNMKHLHNLIWEDELVDSIEIKDEIRNIDLNKILYDEIEYSISDDVRNYLLDIKNRKLLNSARYKIDELHDKISKLKTLYDNGGQQISSSNYVNNLVNQYYNLQLHLNQNRVAYVVFNDYQLLTAKVFDGLINSYLTNEYGLSFFNAFYLIEFTIHIVPSEFKKLLDKVESINLKEECQKEVLDKINNLLKSYFREGLFANSSIRNSILEEYLTDLKFNSKYNNLVSNSFTLLTKTNISKQLFDPLSSNIISFLSIENNLTWFELEEFTKFIKEKGDYFSSKQLFDLLRIVITRDKISNNKYQGLIEGLSIAINKFFPNEKVKDKQLVKKVIADIDGLHKLKYVSHLLLIVDEKSEEILNAEIEEMLDENFDRDTYSFLIRKKLYNYRKKDYFKKLIFEISNIKQKGFTGEFKNNKPIFEGYAIYNFIILLNILDFDKYSKLLDVFTELSDYEKWLLKPKDYNYGNFDVKWLLASDNIYILNSLKGISELKNIVDKELQQNFDAKLSEIYYNYLL